MIFDLGLEGRQCFVRQGEEGCQGQGQCVSWRGETAGEGVQVRGGREAPEH